MLRSAVCSCLVGMLLLAGCSQSPPPDDDTAQVDSTAALTEADAILESGEGVLTPALVERVIAVDVKQPENLVWLARVAQDLSEWEQDEDRAESSLKLQTKAADAMRQLESQGGKLSSEQRTMAQSIFFREACALSEAGEPDPALAALRRAVASGFIDVGKFAEKPELAAVRQLPAYATFRAEALADMKTALRREMSSFQSFPYTFDLSDIHGEPLSLEGLRGRVVVVDYWATWCGPCLRTIPSLIELYDQHQSQGLVVVGLSCEGGDPEEDLPIVRKAVADHKIPYPCAVSDPAAQEQVPNFDSIPTMVFVDRRGQVRFRTTGDYSGEYIEAILAPLLAEAKPRDAE